MKLFHQPRKRFGQNFLHDPNIIQRIIDAISPTPADNLVEIGPGQGALTTYLLKATNQLHVVEIDRDLVALLTHEFSGNSGLTIHNADALRFDFRTLGTPEHKLKIVGNLPYNISTPLLFHLLKHVEVVSEMFFMLQKEVVDRMVAGPNDDAYGRLSVMVQFHCRPEKLFNVGPGAFVPPPKVDSAVIRLTPHTTPPIEVADYTTFANLVNQCFSHRRKTLRNILRATLTSDEIEELGIKPEQRPETLGLREFGALANKVAAKSKS